MFKRTVPYSRSSKSINDGDDKSREEIQDNGHRTPERVPSPVPIPGKLRSTLAFFENLTPK